MSVVSTRGIRGSATCYPPIQVGQYTPSIRVCAFGLEDRFTNRRDHHIPTRREGPEQWGGLLREPGGRGADGRLGMGQWKRGAKRAYHVSWSCSISDRVCCCEAWRAPKQKWLTRRKRAGAGGQYYCRFVRRALHLFRAIGALGGGVDQGLQTAPRIRTKLNLGGGRA